MYEIQTKNTFVHLSTGLDEDLLFTRRPRLNSFPSSRFDNEVPSSVSGYGKAFIEHSQTPFVAITEAASILDGSFNIMETPMMERVTVGNRLSNAQPRLLNTESSEVTVDSNASGTQVTQLLQSATRSDIKRPISRVTKKESIENIPISDTSSDRSNLTVPETRRKGQNHSRKVFFGGLKPTTDSVVLRQYFSRFGPVKDCGIVRDYNGISRRFGYCEFWHAKAAQRLLTLDTHKIDGEDVGIRAYCLRE
jgi:hypothetical protein